MNKQRKKLIFIPGWMDKGKLHGHEESLDIWSENINPKDRIEAEYVVGHSAGSLFTLQNWKINRNTKIILVGSLIPRRTLFDWIVRFIKFSSEEKLLHPIKRIPMFIVYIIPGFIKLARLVNIDSFEIIDEMPKDDIIIIRGEHDNHFCGREVTDQLKEKGIKVIEIKGVGHNWDKKISEEIDRIIGA